MHLLPKFALTLASALTLTACGWLQKDMKGSRSPDDPADPFNVEQLKKPLITEFKPSVELIKRDASDGLSAVTLNWTSVAESCQLSSGAPDGAKTYPGSGSVEVTPESTQKYTLVCTKEGRKPETAKTWVRVLVKTKGVHSCTDLLVPESKDNSAFLVPTSGTFPGFSVPSGTLLPRAARLPNDKGYYEIKWAYRNYTIRSNYVDDPCDPGKEIFEIIEVEKDTTFAEANGIRRCNFKAGEVFRASRRPGSETGASSPYQLIYVEIDVPKSKCEFSTGQFLSSDARLGFGYEGEMTPTSLKIAELRSRVMFTSAFRVNTVTKSETDGKITTTTKSNLEWDTINADSCSSTFDQKPFATATATSMKLLLDENARGLVIRCDGPGGPVTISPSSVPTIVAE
jgi:hypothetical protein